MSAFGGKADIGQRRFNVSFQCLLMTQSGHERAAVIRIQVSSTTQCGNAKNNGRLSRRRAQLIAINYTFLCHPDYALGDQLPNKKLRFSVRVNSAYRLLIGFAHCRCHVGSKDAATTNKW